MRDSWLDLLLGSRCTVCGRGGRVLCPRCAGDLPRTGRVAWPTPCPSGLAVPVAAGEYDGALKALVNGHKEQGRYGLAKPLGGLLAVAATGLLDEHVETAWLFVPVPSPPAVVRLRGHDPMLRVTRVAAAELRRRGSRVWVAPLLTCRARPRDQSGLSAAERAANLAGTMRCPPALAARHRRWWTQARYVVTDDVITTGATAREAQRALEHAGLPVAGIAVVAATRKLLPP